MARNWYSQPPNPNATHMTKAGAIGSARADDADAPAFALYVPYREVAAANPALAANATVNPDRMVWVVTVHADVISSGGIAAIPPQLKHMFSVIIDAENGGTTDMCIGCEAVRDGQLVVVPTRHGADLSHDPTAGPGPPSQR